MDYTNISLLARERHAELIKDAQDNARRVGNGHVIAIPNIVDRMVAGLKALFARNANKPVAAVSHKLATK